MDTNIKFGYYLENLGNPFLVGSLVTEKTFYINKQATELFGITVGDCDLGKVFDKSPERIQALMVKSLNQNKPTLVYNYTAITKENKKILVDLQVGYFNEEQTEVFLEIIPQSDTRLQMAQNQIQNSPRAEAILNLDEKLSIVDCNETFHKVFESTEELRHSHFKNDLVNGFLPEVRDSLIADIHKTLETSEIFSTEIKVFTATGEEKWYRFDLQKRELDNSGMKLMCYMVNIEKQKEAIEKFDLVNQYLSVIQESTVDLLYRVDMATNTMYSYHQFQSIIDNDKVIPDYVNTFFSMDTIHPDDREIYLKGFKEFHENDITCEEPVRFAIGDNPYQWYKITAKKIFDNEGNLTEVFGSLVNVDNEVNMKDEVSTLHKYFDVLNDMSGESLYIVDLKTKKLRLSGLSEKELGLPPVLENYPQSVYEYVHADDLEMYQEFVRRDKESGNNRLELRFKNVDGKYQWYELLTALICDDDGNQAEIFGRIKNIQSKHKLETEAEEANNYLLVMQELSDDILYRIDVEARTLVYTTKSKSGEIVTNVFENYPQSTFNSNLIHPEDEKIILEQTDEWISGNMQQYKLRMKLVTEDYEWYEDSAINIRDKEGEITEIYGRLKNIHAEETMVAEVSTLNQYVEAVQSLSGESLYYVDVKTRILRQKGEVAVELGVPDEIPNYPEGAYPFVYPEHLEKFKIFAEDSLNGKPSSIQCKVMTATGEYQWYEMISMHIYDKTGEMREIFGRMTNIEKEMNIQSDFSELNKYFIAMQNLSDNILFHVDMKTKTFKHANKAAERGGLPTEVPNFIDVFIESGFIRPEDSAKYRECTEKLLSGENMEYEIQASVGAGVYEWFSYRSQFICNEKDEPVEIFGIIENIQVKKDLEQKASHDLMTKVLNKVSFEEEAEDLMLKIHPDKKHALIFIDLDDFKEVNDKLGHGYGDVLLSTVGKRLKRHVREGDLVGRIGGDEFAVLLCNIGEEQSVLERTSIMLDAVKKNFSHEGISVGIRASVGVAVYPQHGTTYKDLIGKSDIAVYESKRRGKNVVSVYSEELE